MPRKSASLAQGIRATVSRGAVPSVSRVSYKIEVYLRAAVYSYPAALNNTFHLENSMKTDLEVVIKNHAADDKHADGASKFLCRAHLLFQETPLSLRYTFDWKPNGIQGRPSNRNE